MQTAGLLALLHLYMRSSLRIQEIVSGHTPEGLNPEKSLELQKFAISLSNDVQSVLGQAVKDELLSTPANVAPLFLRNQISSDNAKHTRDSHWHQQAQLTVQQAGTLSGSLAVLRGEEPADMYFQDCLTTGEWRHSC